MSGLRVVLFRDLARFKSLWNGTHKGVSAEILLRSVGAIALTLASAFSVSAQVDRGVIGGYVTDASGGPIPDTAVTATNTGTNQPFKAMTIATGEYRIFALPVGQYTITIEKPGFKGDSKTGVVVQANSNTRVDLQLQIGTLAQQITVGADPIQVNTDTAQVAETVTSQQIVDLPLNGRETAALVQLVPGVRAFQTVNWWGFETTFVTSDGSRFQNRGTEWLLDGGIQSWTFVNSGKVLPNPDAVQEVQYAGSQRSAEFGRMGSSTVDTITKSGTNTFHGDLWEFLRNNYFNAKSYNQTTQNPQNIQNQFGFTFGGPVWIPKIYNGRNKTFFFTSWQALEQRQQAFSYDVRVPTALERQGDFSQSPVTPINPATGMPYPGNKLPSIDPVSAKILAMLPVGNAQGLWAGTAPNPYSQREFLGKGDQYLGNNHRLSFTYFRFGESSTNQQGSSLPVPGFTAYSTIGVQTHYNGSWTWTLSPTKLNTLRAVYSRTSSDRGWNNNNTLHNLGANFTDGSDQPPLKVIIDGYFSLNATNEGREFEGDRQFLDTFRWTHGAHNMSFGAEVVNYLDKETLPGETWAYFHSDYTGNALANFELGAVSNFQSGITVPPPATRHWLFSGFFQDDWKVTRRLSLNLGVRYEDLTMPVSPNPYGSTFLPYAQSVVFPNAPPGLLFSNPYTGQTDPGWQRGGWLHHPKRFEPRFGFAYDVFGDGKTAVRGGFGIYESEIETIGERNNGNPLNPPSPPPIPPFVSLSNPWNYPGGFDPVANAAHWNPGPGLQPVFSKPWSVGGWDPDYTRPYSMDFSIGIQRQLPQSTLLDVSYVGNLSRHDWYNYNLYSPVWQPGATNTPQSLACRTSYLPCQVGPVFVNGTPGTANYNGLHTYLNRRFNKGLLFQVSYTFAKTIDTNSWPVQDFNYMNMEHARSDDDRKNVFVTNFVYQPSYLHFSNHVVNFFLGGWSLSGIFTAQSGAPVTIYSGTDPFANNYFGGRPNLVGNPFLDPSRSRSAVIQEWFNTSAFALPGPGQFGMGRNLIDGPGMKNLDSSLMKVFRLNERFNFQYRWDMFNALNWVNLNNPHNYMNDLLFGRITGAGSMRQMQMSLKLQF